MCQLVTGASGRPSPDFLGQPWSQRTCLLRGTLRGPPRRCSFWAVPGKGLRLRTLKEVVVQWPECGLEEPGARSTHAGPPWSAPLPRALCAGKAQPITLKTKCSRVIYKRSPAPVAGGWPLVFSKELKGREEGLFLPGEAQMGGCSCPRVGA